MATTHYLYVSFDDPGTADNARTWVDISSRLRSTDGNAGRDSELEAFDALSGSLSLENRDRALDPTNTSSTYSPNVVPNRMLWYQVDVDGTLYDVFKGYVNGWNPDWDEAGYGDFRARPSFTDRTKLLTLGNFTAASPDVLEFPDVVASLNPVLYMRLGEPSGNKATQHVRKKRKRKKDETGRHYRRHGFKRWTTQETKAEAEAVAGSGGVYKNSPLLNQTGAIKGDSDPSVLFRAAQSEWVSVPVEDMPATEFGIVASIKLVTTGSQTFFSTPSKTWPGTGLTASPVRLRLSGGKFQLSTFSDVALGSDGVLSLTSPGTGTWYRVFVTGDASNYKVYLNGTLDNTNALTNGHETTISGTSAIGRDQSVTGDYADAWIDEIAVFDYAPTAAQVQADYDATQLGFDSARTGERILQVLKLHAPQEFADGTFSGNEVTDSLRALDVSGDGRPYDPDTFEGHYTISSERLWTVKQEFAAGRLTFVTDPATPSSGRTVGRFEVRNGDIVASGERLEVAKSFENATAGKRYYAGSFYIPTGWVDTITGSQFKLINQWKDTADLGPPNLGFRLSNGAWNLQVNSGASAAGGIGATALEETVLSSFAKDVWNDWIMEVFWTTTAVSAQGVRIWHKLRTASVYTKVYEHLNIPTLLTGGGTASSVYYKEGEYRNITPRTETDVLYHDYFREGRSYFDMVYGTQSPEGTTGIWPSAINLMLNGNMTTNTTGAGVLGGGSITRETSTDTVFGGTRLKIITPGSVTGEGASNRTATSLQGTSGVAAGDTFIGSVFLKKKAATPHGAIVLAIRVNYTDATNDELTQNYDLTEYWQRYYSPVITANGAKTINSVDIRPRTTSTAQALEFYASGFQIEEGTVATPYIQTDGAAATRSAPRVQVPVTNLDETQGWVAARVRVGWDSTTAHSTNPYIFRWRDDDNNEIRMRYQTTGDQWGMDRRNAGSGAPVVSAAQGFSRSYWATVIGAWSSTQVKVSADGAAFVTAANTNIPTLAATTMDVGSSIGASEFLAGDVAWVAWGRGALTDADAARICAEGPWTPALSDKKGLTVWDGWRTSASPWHIDAGTRTMPPARYAGLPPKELIDDAVAAEGDPARFYISRGGFPTFLDATHRGRAYWSAPRYVFGSATGEIPFQVLALSDEDAYLYNDIRATREEGNQTFQSTDSTSISRYGRLVLPLDSVPLSNDADIQAFIDATLARYKDPMTRIKSFVVIGTTAAIRQVILSLEIGDQVRIRWQPPQGGSLLDQVSYIERRKISGEPNVKVVGEFSVSPR